MSAMTESTATDVVTEKLSKSARRRARAQALQKLYSIDLLEGADGTVGNLEAFEAVSATDAATNVESVQTDEESQFADKLVTYFTSRSAEVDKTITDHSRNWRLDRMSRVDRNILRLGVAELLATPEVAPAPIINDAIELGKRYGTAESGAFINGVIDRIAKALRSDPSAA